MSRGNDRSRKHKPFFLEGLSENPGEFAVYPVVIGVYELHAFVGNPEHVLRKRYHGNSGIVIYNDNEAKGGELALIVLSESVNEAKRVPLGHWPSVRKKKSSFRGHYLERKICGKLSGWPGRTIQGETRR